MLQNLNNLFQSNIKSLEILYILENIKPAARIMVKEEDKDKIFSFFKEKNISYAVSDFKVLKQEENEAYSDKGVKVPVDSKERKIKDFSTSKSNDFEEKGYFFVYVSKQKELAEKAKVLEKENKHRELGILLGYPECCAGFFEEHFEEESKKQNDFTLASLKNSEGFQFPFYTNIASRHFDIALLNHFPCNLNCKDSIELAKKHLEIIEKHDKDKAEIIKGMLKGAVVYTETNGVFLLRYPKLEYNRVYYKGIMGSRNNQIYESLKNADYIEIIKKDRIRLDNLEIKNIGVMLFF